MNARVPSLLFTSLMLTSLVGMQASVAATATNTNLTVAANAVDEKDLAAQRAEYIRKNYTKFEYRIPARDGTLLFTSIYVPNDASASKR